MKITLCIELNSVRQIATRTWQSRDSVWQTYRLHFHRLHYIMVVLRVERDLEFAASLVRRL